MLKKLAFGGVGLVLLVTPLLASADEPSISFSIPSPGNTIYITYSSLPPNSYIQLISKATGNYVQVQNQSLTIFNVRDDGSTTMNVDSVPAGTYLLRVKQSVDGPDPIVANSSEFTIGGTTSATGGSPNVSSQSFCHAFNSDLSIGSTGSEVSALNRALMLSGIEPSGNVFDESTAASVVLFQARYGIRQTGYVGPITRAKLNALYGCSNQPTQPSVVDTTTSTGNPNAPTITFSRSPADLSQGQSQTVSWSTQHATSLSYRCTGTGPNANLTVSETLQRAPYTSSWDTIYNTWGWKGAYSCTWTATGPGGTATYVDNFSILSPGSTGGGTSASASTATITGTVPTGGAGTVNIAYSNIPASSANYIQLIDQATLDAVPNMTVFNISGNGNTAMVNVPTGTYILRIRRADTLTSQPIVAESSAFTVDRPAAANSTPVISSIYPPTVTAGVNTNIVINGSGFRSGAKIVYSGSSSGELPTNYVSSQQITVGPHIWGGTGGTYAFHVENPGDQVSENKTISVIPPPTAASAAAGSAIAVSSFYPTAVIAGGYSNIVITGSNFPRNAKVVYTNAVGATGELETTYISSQRLEIGPYLWNIGGVGDYTFKVKNPTTGAMSESVGTIRVIAPVSSTPFITSISPSPLPAGQTTFAVYGSNFQNGATVNYSGNSLGNTGASFSASFVSSSQLSVTGTGLAQNSSYMLYVRNPGGQTSAGCSTYSSCASTLTVAAQTVVATTAPVINITLNGSAYNGSTFSTTFGGTVAFIWNVTPTSGTNCAASGIGIDGGADAVNLSGAWTTPRLYANTTYGIRCSNSLGTTYKYVSIGVLAQTNTTPVAGTTAPTIKLNDSNDSSRLSINVAFGGKATFNWVVTPTTGTSCSAAGNGVNGTTGSGAVTNLTGSWTTPALYANTTYGVACANTNGTTYKYADVTVAAQTSVTTGGVPTISSINPSSVTTGQTTNFTVTGTNFQSGSRIYYSGTYSGSPGSLTPTFNSYDPTHLTFTTGTLNSGTYTFYVQNLDGQRSGTLNLTVNPAAAAAAAVPSAPTVTFSSTSGTKDTSFTANWGVSGAASYMITVNNGTPANTTLSAWTGTPTELGITTTGATISVTARACNTATVTNVTSQCSTSTQSPTYTVTAPAATYTAPTLSVNDNNPTAGTTISFTWSATNGSGCNLLNNGVYNRALTTSPMSVDTTGLSGLYSVTASCSYPDGQTRTSATVPVTVSAPATVASAQTGTINPSPSTATTNASITISGTASSNVSTVYVAAMLNGATQSSLVASQTNGSWTNSFASLPAGNYTIKAYASNANGTFLAERSLTVTAPAATYTAPTLSVNNSTPTAGNTISFTWSATNGSGCNLLNNGVYNRALTTSPMSVDTTGLSGLYSVTASCSYPDGQTRTSATVPVTVSAPSITCGNINGLTNLTTTSWANYTFCSDTAAGVYPSSIVRPSTTNGVGQYTWTCGTNSCSASVSSVAMISGTNQTASALNALENATQSAGPAQEMTSGFSYTFTQDLYRGQSGAEVSALQQALKAEGLYSGEATGNFYDVTREAVIAFQIKYGIDSTGYVGIQTRTKLNSLYSR